MQVFFYIVVLTRLAVNSSLIHYAHKNVLYIISFLPSLLLTVFYKSNGKHFLDNRLQLFHTQTGCFL
jgi:hypothetical protein